MKYANALLAAFTCLAATGCLYPRLTKETVRDASPLHNPFLVTDLPSAMETTRRFRSAVDKASRDRRNIDLILNELQFYGTIVGAYGVNDGKIGARNIGAAGAIGGPLFSNRYRIPEQAIAFEKADRKLACVEFELFRTYRTNTAGAASLTSSSRGTAVNREVELSGRVPAWVDEKLKPHGIQLPVIEEASPASTSAGDAASADGGTAKAATAAPSTAPVRTNVLSANTSERAAILEALSAANEAPIVVSQALSRIYEELSNDLRSLRPVSYSSSQLQASWNEWTQAKAATEKSAAAIPQAQTQLANLIGFESNIDACFLAEGTPPP